MLSRAAHKRPDYEGNGQNSGRYCHRRFACENGNQNYCAREKKQYVYGDREEAPCELQRNRLSTLSASRTSLAIENAMNQPTPITTPNTIGPRDPHSAK